MNNRIYKIISLVTLGFVLVGCSSEEDTRVLAPLPVVSSEFTPEREWRTSIGNGIAHYFSNLSPAYAYGAVYVASREGEVKAIDPENGKTLWSVEVSDDNARLSGGLTVAYNMVFVGSENGSVYALSTDDGVLAWRAQIGSEILAKPLAEENLVIINTVKGNLTALDFYTGEEVWNIENEVPTLTLRGDSSPVAAGGGVFWGLGNGRLAAAVIARGQLIWQQAISTPKGSTELDRLVDVDTSPLIYGSTLYIAGVNGQVVAIDLRSGQAIWKRNYSSAIDLTTDGRAIFLVTENDHVYALEMNSGTLLWKTEALEYRKLSAPRIIDGYLVLGDTEGYLHWINSYTGEFVAQQLIGDDDNGIAVPPIELSDGFVVVTREGDVQKFTLPSNSPVKE